ncbi:hypothetical protein GT23_3295 [Parageobacillus thermoglucosidasius]|nr:hypothetical protein GT23_3295 [Parageobacillus thermoglucosidasius]
MKVSVFREVLRRLRSNPTLRMAPELAAKEDFTSSSKKKKQRVKCSLPSLFKPARSNFNSLYHRLRHKAGSASKCALCHPC